MDPRFFQGSLSFSEDERSKSNLQFFYVQPISTEKMGAALHRIKNVNFMRREKGVLQQVGSLVSCLSNLNCSFPCCSSNLSRREKSAVITKQKKVSSSRKNSFVVHKYCFRLARTLLRIKNVNFTYCHYRILISFFLLFVLITVLPIDGCDHGV